MAKKRTDAERRIRQSERLGRLLKCLNCIAGSGRWDADALAKELECSRRTVHRLLQALSLAGVPWYFDETTKAYRIRPGFRFNLFVKPEEQPIDQQIAELRRQLHDVTNQAEALVAQLRQICDRLNL